MKSLILLLIPAILLAACSSHTEKTGSASEPTLRLKAQPHQGFAPLRVTLHATLEGVSESDPNYYCLEEKWDFGDGAVSYEKPNCDPFEPGKKIKTEFIVDHLFDEDGSFKIFLTLGNKKIRSRNAGIIVLRQPNKI